MKPSRLLLALIGGLLGEAEIMPVRSNAVSGGFVGRGGSIPAPLQALIN